MNFNDKSNININGTMIFKFYKNGKLIKEEIDKNIVVNQARNFMRNLVFGDTSNVITQFKIGDMNKTLSDDCSNPPQPSASDTDLVHTFFVKDISDKEEIIDDNGNPAIKYTIEIMETEANDASNADQNRKLWCEYALADANGNIWTRKVKPIIKDNETKIIIDYILSF